MPLPGSDKKLTSQTWRKEKGQTFGEIASLQHEPGNDTMEHAVCVTVAVLVGTKLTEVACSLRDNVVEQVEDDVVYFFRPPPPNCNFDVELENVIDSEVGEIGSNGTYIYLRHGCWRDEDRNRFDFIGTRQFASMT